MVEVIIRNLQEPKPKKTMLYIWFVLGLLVGVSIAGLIGKVILEKSEKQQKITRDFLHENNLVSFINYDKVEYSLLNKTLSLYNPKFSGTITPLWGHQIEKIELKGFDNEKASFHLNFKSIKVDVIDAIRSSYGLEQVLEVVKNYDFLTHAFTMTWLDLFLSGYVKLDLDVSFSSLIIEEENKLQLQFVFDAKEMGKLEADLEFSGIETAAIGNDFVKAFQEKDGLALFISNLDISYFALRYQDEKLVKSYKDFLMLQRWHETGDYKEIKFDEAEIDAAIKDLETRGLSYLRSKNVVENINAFINKSEFVEIVSHLEKPIRISELIELNSLETIIKFISKTGAIFSTKK